MSDDRLAELRPCPFCGGTDVEPLEDEDGIWFVTCHACEAEGPSAALRDWAVAAWDRRPGEDGPGAGGT